MTGEKITMGEGEGAPLEHAERKGHGGARRVASREPEPGGEPGTSPQVSAILNDREAATVRATIDWLQADGALRRKDLVALKAAALASLAVRDWRNQLADDLQAIAYEHNAAVKSLNSLRARVIGTDPETLKVEDLNIEEEASDALD